MTTSTVIEQQLAFYRRAGAGCLFAAHAAQDPARFGWRISIGDASRTTIRDIANGAASRSDVSTQSVIFPDVRELDQLTGLLRVLQKSEEFTLALEQSYRSRVCLGFRFNFDDLASWVTGFGPFDFLPRTRRAPFTEIIFRTKPRPSYDWIFKESPPGVVHLADMDMQGMSTRRLKSLWSGSFKATAARLGKSPDLRSAAKTTFAVPKLGWNN